MSSRIDSTVTPFLPTGAKRPSASFRGVNVPSSHEEEYSASGKKSSGLWTYGENATRLRLLWSFHSLTLSGRL
jgi:hypothetical protein